MADNYNTLSGLIRGKSARIGVIGLGYVGLPIVLRFCEEGFRVLGFDVDTEKINALRSGRSYIKHIPSDRIAAFVKKRPALFEATTDMSRLKEADAVIICVPTPLSDKREPDLTYVENSGKEIARALRPGQLI